MKGTTPDSTSRILLHGLILSCILGATARSPLLPLKGGLWTSEPTQSVLKSRGEDLFLRIMPLGASITKGDPAPPGDEEKNGYRKPLRDHLRANGWDVNMVGSVDDWGTMCDKQNEGHPGLRVSEIHTIARTTVPELKPNLILINAGTNDATQNRDDEPANKTHIRIGDMVADFSIMLPNSTIVLSTLLPHSTSPENAQRVQVINQSIRQLFKEIDADAGRRIVLAEMDDGFITLNDIFDGTHPTLLGRRKMAAVWHDAISRAKEKGWLQAPSSDVTFEDDVWDGQCPLPCGDDGESDPSLPEYTPAPVVKGQRL